MIFNYKSLFSRPALKSGLSILLLTAFVPMIASTQETPNEANSEANSDANFPLRYVRLYTDANGASHFKDETLVIRSSAARPTPSTLQLEGARGATILRLKSGAVEDFHKAPRRQWLFMMKGIVEVTSSDGEKRTFAPGDVVLMEDTAGKGHITKSIGKEDHIVLFVPIVEDAVAR